MLLPRLAALPQPFTRGEAAFVGVTRHQLDRETRRGVVTRIHRGLYATTAAWAALAPWEQHPHLARAARRAHPEGVVSHVSAAALLGLPLPVRNLGRAVLTVTDDTTLARHPWIDLRRGVLPATDVEDRGGDPTTRPARTVLDCCRSLALPDAVAIADGALRSGRVSSRELLEVRRRQRRWPGVTGADRAFRLADPRRETWLESTSAVVLESWGVPLGVPQVDVLTADGEWVARVDMAWPELGVVGEADGRGKFIGDVRLGLSDDPDEVRMRLLASHDRAERLRALGLEVVRWTPAEITGRPLRVARDWKAAAQSGAGRRNRALMRCRCCRRPATDCAFDRFPRPASGVSSG